MPENNTVINMFYETVFEGKTLIQSDMLKGLTHYFTTRSSFLAENKDFLARITGIPAENFIAPRQIHSANIAIAPAHGGIIPDTDALILKNKGFALTLNFADCTPVILFDPVLNIAAGIHAGWRGTASLIAQKTALKMIELGSKPENIIAAIGPCIAKCCFEVTEEVVEALKPYTVYEPKGEKFMVDLKETNRRQLEDIGVTKIDISPYCTVCEQDKFFSYRRTKTPYRHNIILALK